MGEDLANKINDLTDDDQHMLLNELVGDTNVKQEIHETVIKEGQEESDGSGTDFLSIDDDNVKHTPH